jgi:menaquinone-specific isochorismate synthase
MIRIEREELDLPCYLAEQDLFPKFYHKCPKTGEERAALGSIKTLRSIPSELQGNECFYGALAFDQTASISNLWKDFPACLFFLPEIEIRQSKGRAQIFYRGAARLIEPQNALAGPDPLGEPKHSPSKEKWETSLRSILHSIEKNTVQKVVAARKSNFKLSGQEEPFSYLQSLLRNCPSTHTFALQVQPSSLFLGSTPEKLYERKQREIFSEAIAGTRARGKTLQEDMQFEYELKDGLKEQNEVVFVKDFLTKTLEPLCQNLDSEPEFSLIKTDTVQHLHCKFHGILQALVTDADILSLLHPTPAVCGEPQEKALSFINETEDFSRGLYAGPIGWISAEESFFVVAIRSALIRQNSLEAFAGAGIVQDSSPDKEWVELDHKIAHWKKNDRITKLL